MTPEEADKEQHWLGMDGATAWHLIDRHADNWNEVGELMNAWLRAHVLAEREACARAAEGFTDDRDDRKWVPGSLYDTLRRETAAFIRKRSNAELWGAPPTGGASHTNAGLGTAAPSAPTFEEEK